MAAPSLELWLHDVLVARVTERRTGRFQLRYTDDAMQRWPLGRPLLSESMPLAPTTYPPGVVGPFLEGLLPEGEARGVLEERYGVRRGDVSPGSSQRSGATVLVPSWSCPRGRCRHLSRRIQRCGRSTTTSLRRRCGHCRIARELGLTEVDADLLEVAGTAVVVVSRYDRRVSEGRTIRLAEVATFTVAIGNADAHGKNLSLLLPPGGRITLAPLYDVMSTVHDPEVSGPFGRVVVSTGLAMFVDGRWQIDAVDVGALRAEASRWHLADDVDERIHGVLDRFEDALEVAAAGVPQAPGVLVDHLRVRAHRLRRGMTVGD